MASTVWIGGVDLDAVLPGLRFTDLPDHLNRPRVEVGRVEIPGRAGAVRAGPIRVAPRPFTLTGYLDGSDTDAARDLLDTLNSLAGVGEEVSIRVADRPDREILAHVVAQPGRAFKPELLSPWIAVDLQLEALDPYWRDVDATVVNLSGAWTAIPCGTAPHGGLLRLLGAATPVVDPSVEYGDATESLIATSDLTVSLGTGDWAELDLDERTIMKSISSVESQDDALLTGGVFPGLVDPRDGVWRLDEFPKIRLTATSGTPTGTLTYRRRWL